MTHTDTGSAEILHCTTPDLVVALRYAANLSNGGDLTELAASLACPDRV
jgi:hypothetical protein